jgi:ABC-type branched-subunit amino acid transport system ATPase component
MTLLRVDNIIRSYGGVAALGGVSLDIDEGGIHGLIGPNGAGKTTLVKVISGEVPPSSGRVLVKGRDVSRWGAAERSQLGIARTFQNIRLFRSMSVFENVLVAAVASNQGEPRTAATKALDEVGLPEELHGRRAGDLAYMPQRLVEIARARVTRPVLLLLDEPAAGASELERTALIRVIDGLRADGVTILLIEHDVELVFRLADMVSVLNQGQLLAHGPAGAIQINQ